MFEVSMKELMRNPFRYFRYKPNGKIDGECAAYVTLKMIFHQRGEGQKFDDFFAGKVD